MLLMEDDPDWSFKRMQAILDSKKTTRINLLKTDPSFVDLLDFLG